MDPVKEHRSAAVRFSVREQHWVGFVRLLDEPSGPVPELVELLQRPTVFE